MSDPQEAVAPTPTEPAAPQTPEPVTPPAEPAPQAQTQEPPAPTPQSTEPQTPESTAEPAEPVARVVPAADGYQLPEGVPPEIGQFAHQNDMTQEQLDATLSHFGQFMQAQDYNTKMALRQAGEAHVKNWGENAQYNLSLAKRALAQNDPDGQLAKALDDSGYGNHPAVLNFLLNIGQSMKEGGFLKSAVPRQPGRKTAAQAMYGETHPSQE